MTINIGDKLVVVKKIASFLDVDDIVEVVDVDESGVISFAFGEGFMHKGVMSVSECEEHFEKIDETAPSITSEHIEEIMVNSDITVQTVFDKCTIVSCRLPNGFVIVESSACVSPENYNEEMGVDICLDKIADKIWELEGYRLQEELYRESIETEECPYSPCDECDCPCDDCNDCDDYDYDYDEFANEDDEEEADCDNCDDYDCPYNNNNR